MHNFPSIHDGPLILVNPHFPFQSQRSPQLTPIASPLGDFELAPEVVQKLEHIFEILNTKEISITDGFRTHEYQKKLYEETEENFGKDYAQNYVALPGSSEHETGLALDMALMTDDIDPICPEFPRKGIAEKFRQLALKHGFIERYQDDKKSITTIAAEPWHFRYVGYPHSLIMDKHQLCLEEYHDFIKEHRYGDRHLFFHDEKNTAIQVAYLSENDTHHLEQLHPDYHYQISGNNIDGFILTIMEELPHEK